MALEYTMTIDEVLEHMKRHQITAPYLPTAYSERIAQLLFGRSTLGRWHAVAKSLYDQGAAISLYVQLFPHDRWLLGFGQARPDEPMFGFAVQPPYTRGEESQPRVPDAIVETEHDICGMAIVMAALKRRQQMPLVPPAKTDAGEVVAP